jgi:hypothetical protein
MIQIILGGRFRILISVKEFQLILVKRATLAISQAAPFRRHVRSPLPFPILYFRHIVAMLTDVTRVRGELFVHFFNEGAARYI